MSEEMDELLNEEEEVFPIIILDDNNLEDCKIQYFHENKLLDINELNHILLEDKSENISNDLVSLYGVCLNKFLACEWTYIPNYLNYSNFDKIVYFNYNVYCGETEPYRIYSLPNSINTIHLLEGILEMDVLSKAYGGHTNIYIQYGKEKVLLKNSRIAPFNEETKELIYNFATNNNLVIEEIDIHKLTLQQFITLFDYMRMSMIYRISRGQQEPEKAEIAINNKIKEIKLRIIK